MTHSLVYFVFGDTDGRARFYHIQVRRSVDYQKPGGALCWSQKNSRRELARWVRKDNPAGKPALVHRAFTFLEPLAFNIVKEGVTQEEAENHRAHIAESLTALGLEPIENAKI